MINGEDTYSSSEAARLLRRSNRRVLQMLEAGELEGAKDESGRWRIPQRAVHEALPARPAREGSGNGSSEPTEGSAGDSRLVSELQEKVETLQREIGRVEGRLELTEAAESTLRESLARERTRADRLEEERERLVPDLMREKDRADRLEAELAEAREAGRGWFRRFFGF